MAIESGLPVTSAKEWESAGIGSRFWCKYNLTSRKVDIRAKTAIEFLGGRLTQGTRRAAGDATFRKAEFLSVTAFHDPFLGP